MTETSTPTKTVHVFFIPCIFRSRSTVVDSEEMNIRKQTREIPQNNGSAVSDWGNFVVPHLNDETQCVWVEDLTRIAGWNQGSEL